jgi:hypothetical protein
MAGYRIHEDDTAVEIELTGVGAKKEAFLEAFAECQAGHCACPTDEYRKVASMEVIGAGDAITVRLETKPGERLDAAQIETCLDYTTANVK